jgi:hypothetical protein
MMLLQILHNRNISVEDGQHRLEEMAAALAVRKKEMSEGVTTEAWGKLHIEGVTIRENPFPEKLRKEFVKLGFVYDDMNLYYQKRVKTREEADAFLAEFEQQIRPRLCSKGLVSKLLNKDDGVAEFAKDIVVRALYDGEFQDDEIAEMESI